MYHLFLLLDLFGVHFFSRQLVHTQVPFGTEYQIQVETVPIAAYSQYNAIHQVVCVFTSRCQNHSKACNFLYDGQLPVQMSGKPCFHWGSYLFFLFSVSSPLVRGSLKLLLFWKDTKFQRQQRITLWNALILHGLVCLMHHFHRAIWFIELWGIIDIYLWKYTCMEFIERMYGLDTLT